MLTPSQLSLWNQTSKILSGTGHRPEKLGREYSLSGPYSQYLKSQILQAFQVLTPKRVISGMALGFDQLLALTALEEKIKVTAAIPCDGQESRWPQESQDRYWSILDHPLVTVQNLSPGPYYPSKMQKRNCWMVDNSDLVLAAWDGSPGGTANCLQYAESREKIIWRIDPRQAIEKGKDEKG